jgi:hypothetical protein
LHYPKGFLRIGIKRYREGVMTDEEKKKIEELIDQSELTEGFSVRSIRIRAPLFGARPWP